ncbi:RNA 2',3'-cyclic phosphodiesterase [Pseudobacteroides cellulosolvens]|uniref:RNA 2',3'-cyclic phosphodiesterase n=1 Tax=Pseudobacteroides cellulosolvens ATCC 35603 = DSM 2933 TaxID=398512 RepID=A0A0L6JU69_9FIRM|nr:RNA 2',3'-cyclic phosphodiesterase [Pseudobacteroides cellulosolvens]KNY29368.1 2'-5' RNA ligase [Pseudobacteroides cellulosolvens ATCC 35603 = DSM 2933]
MRAFIGIDFDKEQKRKINELQQRLRRYAIRGRWKHIDNFHLTLKFLDDISPSQQKQIDNVVKEICRTVKPFSLNIKDIGVFEGRDSIRVLWIGLGGDLEELRALHRRMEELLTPIGLIPEKRSYKPHITIGQDIVFECDFQQIRDSIGKLDFSPVSVNTLHLFKSEQIANKRVYTKVSDYNLFVLQ